jgi:hypothetical protein
MLGLWGAMPALAAGTDTGAGQAAAARATAGTGIAPYADRVMLDAAPRWDDEAQDAAPYDAAGLPRSLRFEARTARSNSDFGPTRSGSVSVRGGWDTLNHGSFSIDGSARLWDESATVRERGGVSFSLQQRGMPFSGGWSASNALGVIQTLNPVSPLLPSAVLVPSRLIQGVATQWQHEGQGLTLQFSAGETGSYRSVGQGAFQGSGNGVMGWGLALKGGGRSGATLLPAGWRYSAWGSRATGGTTTLNTAWGVMPREPASMGVLQSLGWASAGAQAQGQWLLSRSADSGALGAAAASRQARLGLWLDAASAAGGLAHRWGVHRLEPDLSWQGGAVSGNAVGGYYRWSRSGLRTQWDAQLGSSRPLDAARGGISVQQAGLSVRHALSSQLGVGGLLQFMGGTRTAMQLTGYLDAHPSWADVRLQSGAETTSGQLALVHVASDQAWRLPGDWRLSSSQAWSTSRRSVSSSAVSGWARSLELGAAGGTDVGASVTVDVSARASLPLADAERARLYQLSVNGQWHVAPGWSVGLSLARSHSSGLAAPELASPLPSLPGSYVPASYAGHSARDVWLSLRYDFQAGMASLPLGAGARADGGSGAVEGVVFFDDNGNGRLDAREGRAADITVVLDGRYSIRTDAQGHYEFPFVASGTHSLQVASDTLPLPWAMPNPDAVTVVVQPRDSARQDFAAQRERAGALSPGWR